MAKTYYLHSLGCKVNSYENASIGTELSSHGLSEVHDSASADIVLLNTCSVTGKADAKSRQHISSFRKGNPKAILIVMGCYSQDHANEAAALGADIVLGSADRSKIWECIKIFISTKEPIVDVKKSVRKEVYEELATSAFCDNARAYLKVQDGCDNFCSYCKIPFIRGNSRSRDPRSVLDETKKLVEKGYKEIIITGIHIGAYGKDLGDGSFRLGKLIDSMCQACPELPRIRISSIEESEIDDDFLKLLTNRKQVVDHLHIPLQSGSSSVLKRMKRKYDTVAFLDKLKKIREIRPDIAITTDVIAGFPLESEEEWNETMEFCKKANFAEIHVFPFSSRPGTYAATLKDVDPRVKKARVKELMGLSSALRKEYEKKFYGQDLEILFEDYDAERKIADGHSANYLKVSIPSNKPLHGQMQIINYNPSVASD